MEERKRRWPDKFNRIYEILTLANTTMRNKLLTFFVILVLLPILLISYASYTNYANSIQKNTKEYVLQGTSEALKRIDDYIADIELVTKIPLYSKEMQENLRSPQGYVQEAEQTNFYLQLMGDFKPGFNTIYIFDNFGHLFYNRKSAGIRDNIVDTYQSLREVTKGSSGEEILTSTQKIKDVFGQTQYVFSVTRDIKDMQMGSYQSLGTVVVDIDLSLIENSMAKVDSITKGKTLILDQDNHVVFDSNKKYLTMDFSGNAIIPLITGKEKSFDFKEDGVNYLCTYVQSNLTGWKMIVYIPQYQLIKEALLNRNVTLGVILIFGGLGLLIAVFLSFSITKPIRKVADLMRSVQEGNLNVSIQVKYRDEVGLISSSFNKMIFRIRKLIDEVYDMGVRKKEAELTALQSQINPHFIYNTLETIRMRAIINDDSEVSEMTLMLGKLLRYGIIQGHATVTVEQELEHLKNYMSIQNYRFKNRFELRIAIPEALIHMEVIKLIFQPVVENAIFHGIEKKTELGIISISSQAEKGTVRFIIEDNGVGMTEDQLIKLKANLNTPSSDHKDRMGIGLRNVHERIKLHYGETYGLEINSVIGQGTQIIMVLPQIMLTMQVF